MEEVKNIKRYRVQSEYTNTKGQLRRIGPMVYEDTRTIDEFRKNFDSIYAINIINDAIRREDSPVTLEMEEEWRNNLIIQEIC